MKKLLLVLTLALVAAQQVFVTPSSGTYGASVSITGEGFPNGSCNILGAIVKNFTCVVENSNLRATFLVQNEEFGATPANYSLFIQFANNRTATAYFLLLPPEVVKTNPTITLTPNAGPVGTFVKITGSGFYQKAKGCQILSPVAGNYRCFISGGSLSANFTAANVQPGNYSVIVKTSYNETASSTFTLLQSQRTSIYQGLVTPQTSGFATFENTVYFVLAVAVILIVIALVYFFVISKRKKSLA